MSGDLRTAVEGLTRFAMVGPLNGRHMAMVSDGHLLERSAVLALLPEGAVLVTEETLAAAIDANWPYLLRPLGGQKDGMRESAAAILRHLREGT